VPIDLPEGITAGNILPRGIGLSDVLRALRTGDDPHLRQRVTAVLDRLGDHEMAETELMLTVEYRDLGTGD
jgi:hypothetical protein